MHGSIHGSGEDSVRSQVVPAVPHLKRSQCGILLCGNHWEREHSPCSSRALGTPQDGSSDLDRASIPSVRQGKQPWKTRLVCVRVWTDMRCIGVWVGGGGLDVRVGYACCSAIC